jgi:hypothetical protein
MKTIIAGSRTFDSLSTLNEAIAMVPWEITEVVSGTARGADQLGETWAHAKGIPLKRYPADWDTHGKSAGYIRNEVMAKYGDGLVAFWDGKSRGTEHMINLAKKHGLRRIIVSFTDDPTDFHIEEETT